MAKIQNKWLAADAVDESKIKLSNDGSLRARNNLDTNDVNIGKLDTSDEWLFEAKPKYAADPTADDDLARKKYVDDQVGSLGSAVEYKGTYNASTNSPALVDGTGTTGDLYRVNVAGSQDFGSGSISFAVGDKVVYNPGGTWEKWDDTDAVDSVNGQTGAVSLDSDDISEGSTNLYYTEGRFDTSFSGKSTTDLSEGTNLYHTDARAKAAAVSDLVYGAGWDAVVDVAPSKNAVYDKIELLDAAKADASHTHVAADITDFTAEARTAAVVNSTAGSETDQAASVSAMKSYVAANSANTAFGSEVFTLAAGDITNGYVEIAQEALSGSIMVHPKGGPVQVETDDYTLSVPVAVTRVTFAGDLASELAAGDKLVVKYSYEA